MVKKKSIITFKDIRDVNKIVSILLIHMDYEYLGKDEGKMKYYYDGLEEEWTGLNSFIKNNYLLKKINILSLNSDGNTITINAQNWQVKSLIKEIKKFTIKSKKKHGDIINIGSNFEISIRNTAQIISKLMGTKINIKTDKKRLSPKASEVNRLLASNNKAKKLIKWQPKYSGLTGFRRGLSKTIKWFSQPNNLSIYNEDSFSL